MNLTIAELLAQWKRDPSTEIDPEYDPWGAKSFNQWLCNHYPDLEVATCMVTTWYPIRCGEWETGEPRYRMVEQGTQVEYKILGNKKRCP